MDTVVVLGASGGVGRGIVRELLASGHEVVAIGRDPDRLAGLSRELGDPPRLKLLPGSVSSDEEASRLMARLAAHSSALKAAISCIGGTSTSARMLDQPAAFLRHTLEEDVVSHFIAAKHLIPLLGEKDREALYLVVSGPAAECAWSGYGHRSIAAAALRMLTLVAKEEAKDLPVRVQQLQICRPVRTGRISDCDCPEWLEPEQVGGRVVELIAGAQVNDTVIRLGGYDHVVESVPARTTTDREHVSTRSLHAGLEGGTVDLPAGSGSNSQWKGEANR